MRDYVVVDVFTDRPLAGNPVAVFPDAAGMSESQMRSVARELKLSETVFVFPARGGGDAEVRIFTPVNELPFAGHPTLGTAILLGQMTNTDRVLLETGMGIVPFDLQHGAGAAFGVMAQPIPRWEPYDRAEELLTALGLTASTLPVDVYRNGPRHVYVGVDDVAALSGLRPDHRALAELPDVAVNCFAGAGAAWRMRMFSPAYGVVEDAATGSAAGPLAVHLIRYGMIRLGRLIRIEQGVEMSRRSRMYTRVEGDRRGISRVQVGGSAVVAAHGSMHV
ncbi:PhzF family phenazine biosynthesis protein [Actinophytocola sp.]|uniref:PhzF family phenazine biosynthesis protein n=1 Tax=Actinophytocola sp. TaxID=1872138 RepID=UPI002ED1973D